MIQERKRHRTHKNPKANPKKKSWADRKKRRVGVTCILEEGAIKPSNLSLFLFLSFSVSDLIFTKEREREKEKDQYSLRRPINLASKNVT